MRNRRFTEVRRVAVTRRVLLITMGVVLGAYLIATSLFGTLSLPAWWKLHTVRSELQRDIVELHERQASLEKELTALESDREYVERLARAELGLVRPGELIYRFRPREE